MVFVQYFFDPGPCRSGDCGGRRAGLRLEGGVARGVLVVYARGVDLSGRQGAAPDRGRRRGCDAPDSPGVCGRERCLRAGQSAGEPRRGGDSGVAPGDLAAGAGQVACDGRRAARGFGRDHHRRTPALSDDGARRTALPGHQRQRLGDEVEVRQPVRLSGVAGRRHQTGYGRHDCRKSGRGLRLRRRGEGGVRPVCGTTVRG